MVKYGYSMKEYDKEQMARVVGTDLNISTKHSIEICSMLRKKELNKAKAIMQNVIKKKQALPFKRFNGDVGHKKAIGPGRFPLKASTEIFKLLRSVETNAQQKGLNTANLIISHMNAQRAGRQWRYGRIRGREMKRTHIEIVVKEQAKKKEKKPVIEGKKKEVETKKEETKTASEKEKAVEKKKVEAPKEEVKTVPQKEKKPETKKEEKPTKEEKKE
jgi:large subunit ribosomal protein L22